MYREPILREVALVSYGTQYLRGDIALDDWYRHNVFEGATLQFRDLAENALLADDFTFWLCELKAAGAVRLSLHLAAELGLAMPAACDGDRMIVVHHAERHQLWAAGRERSAWDRMVTAEEEEPGWLDRYLHSAAYYADVDSYWLVEERAGALDVPVTDWKALASMIGADLAIPVPAQDVRAEPFFVARRSDTWAALPLFPGMESSMLAHRLLATLYHEQAAFADERNPKNENSGYRNFDERAAAESANWGARLDGWVTEVLLRCANETRGVREHRFREPLSRLTPEPAQRNVDAIRAAGSGARKPDPAPLAKWGRRLGFALTAAGLTVLLFASAHILARYPWVGLAIGLMITYYLWRKK